jgi:hypothetical protein
LVKRRRQCFCTSFEDAEGETAFIPVSEWVVLLPPEEPAEGETAFIPVSEWVVLLHPEEPAEGQTAFLPVSEWVVFLPTEESAEGLYFFPLKSLLRARRLLTCLYVGCISSP